MQLLRQQQQQQGTNKSCSPVSTFFLSLYKGVETKTAAPSLFFGPPEYNQPTSTLTNSGSVCTSATSTSSGRRRRRSGSRW